MTGFMTLLFFSNTIFVNFKYDGYEHSTFYSAIIGAIAFIFTSVGALSSDKLGRKPILFFGVIMCFLFNTALTVNSFIEFKSI
jgi:hypothetical protein